MRRDLRGCGPFGPVGQRLQPAPARMCLAAFFLCTLSFGHLGMPSARAQNTPSCTLRTPLELFSKLKGQGLSVRLGVGTVIGVLGTSGGWYWVYSDHADGYVTAVAYARACATPNSTTSPATGLIDIPLEPLPSTPPAPDVRSLQTGPRPAPKPPVHEPALPESYFEPPAPIIERAVVSRSVWEGVELGLWIGGGVTLAAAATLYTVNSVRYEGIKDRIVKYNQAVDTYHRSPDAGTYAAIPKDAYAGLVAEKNQNDDIDVSSWVLGSVGVAALGTALGLHYLADDTPGSAEPETLSMRVGWGQAVVQGRF